ncbi:cytochrome P450 [Bisporella sp. PMI_857]|nr:cytochrome P450 [Bisporella sp. PMI_857]
MPEIRNVIPDGAFFSISLRAIAYLVLIGAAFGLYRGYKVRSMVHRVHTEHGIFILPHSWLFGHLLVIAKAFIKGKIPPDAHGQLVPIILAKEYPEVMKMGLVYMDVWPISDPMLSVFHPEIIVQFTQEQSQLKHPQLKAAFADFSGGTDLVCSDGPEWKQGRKIFNPGFAASNLLSMIPAFIEEVNIFVAKLRDLATKGNIIKLEDPATTLTIDIIGQAVFGVRLNTQRQSLWFITTLLKQISLLSYDFNWKLLNPLRPIRHWYYNRSFRNAMIPYIQGTISNHEKIEGPKTILKLAVKSYVEDQAISGRGSVPPEFIEKVANHIKIFLLAGHDTTATTIAYAWYELSLNPQKLSILRAEHDKVLGLDLSHAAERIATNPALLNQMPYTLAVIKETLRLWVPISTVRIGGPNFFLTHPQTGVRYPAESFMLFSCSKASHRHPEFWPEPDAFIPERFVVPEGDPLHPYKNAWRPFEIGMRNCVGQELATLELRLILALTVREFDVEICYKKDAPNLWGTKAYQMTPPDTITAHPKDGMPVRLRRRMP